MASLTPSVRHPEVVLRIRYSLVSLYVAISLAAVSGTATAASEALAVRLGTAPTIDGRITDDAAWRGVRPETEFTQVRPEEGKPASQKTEVFIGFTDHALYIGVICHDDNPEGILVTNARRDSSLSDTDGFLVVIDSFLSRQNGVVFGTNPVGIEFDGQVTAEGANRFGQDGFDLNWDTTWTVKSEINESGWSAEMELPFTSLRYSSDEIQSWGINFQRNIRRNNERVFWSPLPRQFGLNRLSMAGTVTGIEVPPQRNLELTPYVLARTSRGGTLPGRQTDEEFGFDLKYSLTPSLTLDATYNTDFAQVEVDNLQVNLNRFSLFFPEKRPFFLENAGQFSVGAPGEVELFFSRRIGIGPAGEQIPIDGGLRLSGKVGNGTNLGLLAMRSEAVTGIASENDFAVVRLNQEVARRSAVGMLFVNRDGGGTDNQTFAVDGRWGIGDRGTVSGFVAKTSTDGIDDDDHAFRLAGSYDSDTWSYSGSYSQVGAGFNPEVGFLRRKDYEAVRLFVLRSVRASRESGVLEYRPHASFTGHWNTDGFFESGLLHIDSSIEWKSGAQLHTAWNITHEGVVAPFEISDGVTVHVDDYRHNEFSMFSGTDQSAALSFGLGVQAGGFFGGDRLALSPSVTYRWHERFNASLSWNHNDIDLPGGEFDVALTRLRLSYSFSPKMSVQMLVQHNDRDDLLATNLRFTWIQTANTGLYVVYNEVDDDRAAPGRPRREFILKYNHILRLI